MDAKNNKVETCAVGNDVDQHPMDELDTTGVLVKPKWRGTSHDKTEMETLGRKQVLRVRKTIAPQASGFRSVAQTDAKNPCRGIFDSYLCSGLEAHSSVPGRSCWRDLCNYGFRPALCLICELETSSSSASTVVQETCFGATLRSSLVPPQLMLVWRKWLPCKLMNHPLPSVS